MKRDSIITFMVVVAMCISCFAVGMSAGAIILEYDRVDRRCQQIADDPDMEFQERPNHRMW